MADDVDLVTLMDLCNAVREQIPYGNELEHSCDVFVTEACRCWPADHMEKIADNLGSSRAADKLLDALGVTVAKVRENVESRWNVDLSHDSTLGLVLRACVVGVANIWFESSDARDSIRSAIVVARRPRAA